jgi:hypothetical protein
VYNVKTFIVISPIITSVNNILENLFFVLDIVDQLIISRFLF